MRQSSPVSPRPGRSETTVTVIERSRDPTDLPHEEELCSSSVISYASLEKLFVPDWLDY